MENELVEIINGQNCSNMKAGFRLGYHGKRRKTALEIMTIEKGYLSGKAQRAVRFEAIAIACGYNPEGGTRNYDFSTYDSHSNLCDALIFRKSIRKPRWGYFYRAESFYNVATQEMEYADGAHPSERYHDRSHGEGFMKAVRGNLSPDSLYFFDEPEAALSPQRQLNILAEIYDTANAGSQFIIATHSPILLGLPGADIWNFDNEKIHPCEYEETGSYVITEAFINNRAMMLSKLINP